MCYNKLEIAIKAHTMDRMSTGKSAMLPIDIYNAIEESMPHGLVIRLGELIIKLKGAGN